VEICVENNNPGRLPQTKQICSFSRKPKSPSLTNLCRSTKTESVVRTKEWVQALIDAADFGIAVMLNTKALQ
jgi:hypothetical protein